MVALGLVVGMSVISKKPRPEREIVKAILDYLPLRPDNLAERVRRA